jgi:hypothetical protein
LKWDGIQNIRLRFGGRWPLKLPRQFRATAQMRIREAERLRDDAREFSREAFKYEKNADRATEALKDYIRV